MKIKLDNRGSFEVDTDALHKFCMENGKPVIKDNANNANTN